tara:strand:- start:57 stop:425 length:369 start_codon:yes stop_codon:yes gene_type:complete
MKNTTSLFGKRPDPIVLTEKLRVEKSIEGKALYLNYTMGTDTNAYEVVHVSPSGKTVFAKEMEVNHKKGAEPYSQSWEFTSSNRLGVTKFTLRKNGAFRQVGMSCGYARPSHSPRHHYDYSF